MKRWIVGTEGPVYLIGGNVVKTVRVCLPLFQPHFTGRLQKRVCPDNVCLDKGIRSVN